jgi:copper(I)-binding protein
VNRTKSRASAVTAGLAACGLAAAVTLTGCGAGQISQTANQLPAVNGTAATIGDTKAGIDLRNVYLRAQQSRDFVKPGTVAELVFVAVNKSPDTADKLLSVQSPTGEVMVRGEGTVPAGGALLVGNDDKDQTLPPSQNASTATAEVALTRPISNGLTYKFTFKFQNAGEAEVEIPISAGADPRRS